MNTIKILIAAGGKEWQAGDKHRIYFNASVINEICGFTFKGKDTFLDGDLISRNRAWKETMTDGGNVKFYYDVATEKFTFSMVSTDTAKKAAKILREFMAVEAPAPTVIEAQKKDKGAIMRAAWAIAKEAAKNFGGSSKSYLSEALKMAHRGQSLNIKPKTYTCCGCGDTISPVIAMSSSRGTVCPDCYDRCSN
jgi:hypothetical protein